MRTVKNCPGTKPIGRPAGSRRTRLTASAVSRWIATTSSVRARVAELSGRAAGYAGPGGRAITGDGWRPNRSPTTIRTSRRQDVIDRVIYETISDLDLNVKCHLTLDQNCQCITVISTHCARSQ